MSGQWTGFASQSVKIDDGSKSNYSYIDITVIKQRIIYIWFGLYALSREMKRVERLLSIHGVSAGRTVACALEGLWKHAPTGRLRGFQVR